VIGKVVEGQSSIGAESERRQAVSGTLDAAAKEASAWMGSLEAVIAALGTDLEAVKETLAVIETISNDSSLLAMNAAIEAAHAGASGKGFAVVASEMRRLSDSTREHSARISEALGAMMLRIEEISSAGLRGREVFGTVYGESGRMLEAFASIRKILDGLAPLRSEAEDAVRGLGTASERMREIFGQVERVGTEIRGAGRQARAGGAGMGSLSRDAMGRVDSMRNGQEALSASAEANQRAIEELMALLDRYGRANLSLEGSAREGIVWTSGGSMSEMTTKASRRSIAGEVPERGRMEPQKLDDKYVLRMGFKGANGSFTVYAQIHGERDQCLFIPIPR
jgi:methyl-accepting chemotaxis protein